jgi:hypothetical protein
MSGRVTFPQWTERSCANISSSFVTQKQMLPACANPEGSHKHVAEKTDAQPTAGARSLCAKNGDALEESFLGPSQPQSSRLNLLENQALGIVLRNFATEHLFFQIMPAALTR